MISFLYKKYFSNPQLKSSICIEEGVIFMCQKNSLIKIIIVLLILLSISSFSYAQNDFEDLQIPTEASDLINNFSMIEYDIITFDKNGEKNIDTNMKYTYLGKEKINGIETDKISIEIADKIQENTPNKIYFWFADNKVKQMQIDEQVLSENMASMMADRFLNTIFSPLKQLEQYNIAEFKKVGKVTKYTENYEGNDLNITKIEVQNIPEYELKYGMTEIAELKNTSIVLAYEYISSESKNQVNFKVQDFQLH
jgi:hypothetical protein